MPVRNKELEEVRDPVRYMNGSEVTLEALKEALEEAAENYGIPLRITEDEVEYSLFSSQRTPCLVIEHPKHDCDYYNFCIQRKAQGNTCVISVSSFGRSSQMAKEQFAANTKVFDGAGSRGTVVGVLRGGAVGAGFAMGSAAMGLAKGGIKALAKGINALTRDSGALEEEKGWYDVVFSIFNDVIC